MSEAPGIGDSPEIAEIRSAVRQLCGRYGEDYWLALDRERGYPTEFVRELTDAGFLTVLIPEEYGGAGLGVREAAVVMEEVCRSGAHAGACHAQMYCATAARPRRSSTCRPLPPAICGCRASASPNRPRGPIPPVSRPSRAGTATSTGSTARRSGSAASSTPT